MPRDDAPHTSFPGESSPVIRRRGCRGCLAVATEDRMATLCTNTQLPSASHQPPAQRDWTRDHVISLALMATQADPLAVPVLGTRPVAHRTFVCFCCISQSAIISFFSRPPLPLLHLGFYHRRVHCRSVCLRQLSGSIIILLSSSLLLAGRKPWTGSWRT